MPAKKEPSWKSHAKKLRLGMIEPVCRDGAREAFIAGNADFFASSGYSSGAMLELVAVNRKLLKVRDIYEATIVSAVSGCKTNHRHSGIDSLALLLIADKTKLRAASDPLPGDGPFTIFRGTSRDEAASKECGISWTLSRDVACKFACAWHGENGVVLRSEVAESEVFFFTDQRSEQEMICKPTNWRVLRLSRATIREAMERVNAEQTKRTKERLKKLTAARPQSHQ